MPLEITVGPPQLAINEGNVVLVTDPDGQIVFPSDKGVYFFDTRLTTAGAFQPTACLGISSTAGTSPTTPRGYS